MEKHSGTAGRHNTRSDAKYDVVVSSSSHLDVSPGSSPSPQTGTGTGMALDRFPIPTDQGPRGSSGGGDMNHSGNSGSAIKQSSSTLRKDTTDFGMTGDRYHHSATDHIDNHKADTFACSPSTQDMNHGDESQTPISDAGAHICDGVANQHGLIGGSCIHEHVDRSPQRPQRPRQLHQQRRPISYPGSINPRITPERVPEHTHYSQTARRLLDTIDVSSHLHALVSPNDVHAISDSCSPQPQDKLASGYQTEGSPIAIAMRREEEEKAKDKVPDTCGDHLILDFGGDRHGGKEQQQGQQYMQQQPPPQQPKQESTAERWKPFRPTHRRSLITVTAGFLHQVSSPASSSSSTFSTSSPSTATIPPPSTSVHTPGDRSKLTNITRQLALLNGASSFIHNDTSTSTTSPDSAPSSHTSQFSPSSLSPSACETVSTPSALTLSQSQNSGQQSLPGNNPQLQLRRNMLAAHYSTVHDRIMRPRPITYHIYSPFEQSSTSLVVRRRPSVRSNNGHSLSYSSSFTPSSGRYRPRSGSTSSLSPSPSSSLPSFALPPSSQRIKGVISSGHLPTTVNGTQSAVPRQRRSVIWFPGQFTLSDDPMSVVAPRYSPLSLLLPRPPIEYHQSLLSAASVFHGHPSTSTGSMAAGTTTKTTVATPTTEIQAGKAASAVPGNTDQQLSLNFIRPSPSPPRHASTSTSQPPPLPTPLCSASAGSFTTRGQEPLQTSESAINIQGGRCIANVGTEEAISKSAIPSGSSPDPSPNPNCNPDTDDESSQSRRPSPSLRQRLRDRFSFTSKKK